jgi:hypothetical protein
LFASGIQPLDCEFLEGSKQVSLALLTPLDWEDILFSNSSSTKVFKIE